MICLRACENASFVLRSPDSNCGFGNGLLDLSAVKKDFSIDSERDLIVRYFKGLLIAEEYWYYEI